MDDAWETIVPIEYRNQIVCVKCFEAFASAKQIELLRPDRPRNRDETGQISDETL